MVCVVQVVDGEATVVVVAVGVVAAGAGHGLLYSSDRQLTKTPLQATLTSLPAVRARLEPTQPWDRKRNERMNKITLQL